MLDFRFRHIPYSSSTTSSVTVQNEENDNYYSCTGEIDLNNLQIPIVGYEVMEERARFTVSTALFITSKNNIFLLARYLNCELKIKQQETVGMSSGGIQTL